MHKSVKYAVYGAALAGIVSGTLAWTSIDKTVTVSVDGSVHHIHTTAGSVRGALADGGYRVGAHDVVSPGLSTGVHDGSRVVLHRGRLLHLSVDGHGRDAWVTGPTVADAMGQLGYSSRAFSSLPRDARLPLSPTDLTVRTPRQVRIQHDGKTQTVSTTAPTVRALLGDLHITMGEEDTLTAKLASTPKPGERIVLHRVRHATIRKSQPVPYPTTKQTDPSLAWGQTQVVQAGKPGTRQTRYAVVYVDGKVAHKTQLSSKVTVAPVAAVVEVGAAASTPDQARAAGAQLVAARGWGPDQFSCLENLWNKESGWRTDAANPSGAYGIPQALPGDKMASAGPDWQTNAVTQITWGLDYIAGRYGTPCAAWGHSQATNWY